MNKASARLIGVVIMLALLAFAAGAILSLRFDVRTTTKPTATTAALFAQAFNDVDGRMQAISQWEGGLLVVNFWATWCAPCIEEMPDLQKVQSEYASRGVTIVGIAIDNPAAVRRFRDEQHVKLPLLLGGAAGSDLVRDLGNPSGSLPYTVLIARNGSLVKSKLGRLRSEELRLWLDAQLAGDPAKKQSS